MRAASASGFSGAKLNTRRDLMSTRTSRLLNALGNLALIVAGVLIALAVDQAAQSIGERRREAEYLAALQEDVQADLAALRGPLSEGLDRREAAAQLVIAGLNGTLVEPAPLVAALDRAGHVAFFAPRRATFDDLISTGNLRLIRDRETRATLIEYYDVSQLDAANELIRQEIWYGYRPALDQVLDPLVLAQITLIEGDATHSSIEDFASAIPPELAARGLRLAELRESTGFRAGIGGALEYTYFQRRQHNQRIADAEALLAVVMNAPR